ncbi:hypothetical protein [Sinomonas sp. P10A9]|uniref:Uncharacterized protein n=1 Tax=Sinomonas puerhi TaxID=3238584 RepID=A0AB39KZS0_9MICC
MSRKKKRDRGAETPVPTKKKFPTTEKAPSWEILAVVEKPSYGRCPDCAGRWNGTALEHNSTCPLMAAENHAVDLDRQFFEDHPQADYFYRPMVHAEVVTLRASGQIGPDEEFLKGLVRVEQIAPGIRTRLSLFKVARGDGGE